MRSGRRQPPNHRLANIQKRRSALPSRGRGYRRCSTSNCCRKQRFSAINRAFGLNIAAMAHSRSRNTRPSSQPSASRSDSPATCQRQRGRWLFLRPTRAVVTTRSANRLCEGHLLFPTTVVTVRCRPRPRNVRRHVRAAEREWLPPRSWLEMRVGLVSEVEQGRITRRQRAGPETTPKQMRRRCVSHAMTHSGTVTLSSPIGVVASRGRRRRPARLRGSPQATFRRRRGQWRPIS
jgi:hypothetical protein